MGGHTFPLHITESCLPRYLGKRCRLYHCGTLLWIPARFCLSLNSVGQWPIRTCIWHIGFYPRLGGDVNDGKRCQTSCKSIPDRIHQSCGKFLTLVLGLVKPAIGNMQLYLGAPGVAFNDITEGKNPGCGTNGFNATVGWDPVTGLGTPRFLGLLDLFFPHPFNVSTLLEGNNSPSKNSY